MRKKIYIAVKRRTLVQAVIDSMAGAEKAGKLFRKERKM